MNKEYEIHHWAVANRSEQEAFEFYQEILGLDFLYRFALSPELSGKIFSLSGEIPVLVFGTPLFKVEIFVTEPVSTLPSVHHICLVVPQRNHILQKVQQRNLPVIRIPRQGRETVFVRDFSGNLIELKEQPNAAHRTV